MFFQKFNFILLLFAFALWIGCASVPNGSFLADAAPPVPDYSLTSSWAALPEMKDSADLVPGSSWENQQSGSAIDVFFIHPTSYIGKAGEKNWNADIRNEKVNQRTDEGSIKYQASVFNGVGKIYAPRYRQAHLNCFYEKKQLREARAALDLAYLDVQNAFQYYLDHFNQGRPFIIATHSQGTYHGIRLIREFIDGREIQARFVVAYLVGYPVEEKAFTAIPPCLKPEQTDCFCSWRTLKEGYLPKKFHFPEHELVVTHPVTWDALQTHSSKAIQQGGVLLDFEKIYPQLVEARVYEDVLWVSKPKFPWSFLWWKKNYHIADYNLFYADIRQNVRLRVETYLNNRN